MKRTHFAVFICLLAAVLTLALLQPTTVHAAGNETRYCQGCEKKML